LFAHVLFVLFAGHKVLIDHGRIQLKVIGAFLNGDFFCNVIKGGELKAGQDVFFPEIFKFLELKPIAEDDFRDLRFAVENDIDFIIASHVECGLNIREIKSHIGPHIKVLAKIQNRFAVDEIGEIVAESDGIIFAPSVEIEAKVIPFMYRIILYTCKVNMKVLFITLDAPLEYTAECEVVNWLMSSGDGSMITRDAAEGREQLATLTRLEGINSFISSSREAMCSQVDEFCLHYHDHLIVLSSNAVTLSLTTSACAIFILSENDLLASGVYFHLPKCVVIPIVESDKIARQLNIFNGFVPLCWRDAAAAASDAKKMMMMSGKEDISHFITREMNVFFG
jgi:pyruvate kinase